MLFSVLKRWPQKLTIHAWIRHEKSLEQAESIESGESDPETAKQAMDNVQEAKRLLALARKAHLKDIRQLELDKAVEFFDIAVREHARPTEANAFDNLV
jgi:molecular chaperone DnaK